MFNKGDIINFQGKPSLVGKNNIYLYGAQGIIKKTYKLKLNDTFKVIEYFNHKLILKPIDINIEDDYWFYQVQVNDKNFKISTKIC